MLICDDSQVARTQMIRSLQGMGLKVISANNGREAWNILKDLAERDVDVATHFLLLISDIEMPEMDGYTLTSMIRSDTRMDKLHVILHTSLSGGFNVSMVKKVGADGFLAKFNPDDLASVVVKRINSVKQH